MQTAFLGDPLARDAQRVGAKAATLSRLAATFRVPAGYCLDASVHGRLAAALDGDATAVAALRELVSAGYTELCGRTGHADPAVAVRSSAIGEDGVATSFAGQHETVLNVHGPDAIVAAVLRCWRSATSERALAYRAEHRITEAPRVGVLVQVLVDADVAAIAFSAHPVTRDRNVVFVNASWGLGESLASGAVTPDEYEITKSDLVIVRRGIADKAIETVRTPDGTADRLVPDARRRVPALDDDRVREVARLAIALEAESGHPVDIECAFSGGELYLLQSRPITTLESHEFPVRWADPADADLTWNQEDAHTAEARPYLSADYSFHGPQVGINTRLVDQGGPVRVRYALFNCYVYVTAPLAVAPEEVAEARARVSAKSRQQARQLRQTWDTEYLPAVHEHYAWIRAQVPETQDRAAAVAAWIELWRRVSRIWITHMRTTGPAYNVMDELAERYAALTGRPATEAPILIQGRAETLQAMERCLYHVVLAVRDAPAVARAIENGDARSLEDLEALPGGGPVAGELWSFLERFGDAGQLGLDLRNPAWLDEPRLVLVEIARRLRGELEDPDARHARLIAISDALAERTRETLRDRPADLARFEEVLAVARAAGPLTEEHNYWIDRRASAHVRRAVLRFGERLVRDGSLDAPGDIFYFWADEITEALRAPRDLRPLVRERSRELRWAERLRAPQTLGKKVEVVAAANARIIDLGFRVAQTGGDVLTGVPASAGVARGPARLIRDASRFDRFQRGDVLVCRSSQVSWIPLFTIASAVVADIGGALSHAAVVAREFGVPAVVGTGTALDTLVDGEQVEVDGTAGTVRRLAPKV